MYQAVYKCRLCGKMFLTDKEYKKGSAVRKMIRIDINTPYSNRGNEIHYCTDGNIGFADFMGFKKVEG